MSEAQDRVKELRAQVAAAEAVAKEERLAKRRAERDARQAEEHRLAQEHRENNFEHTVGKDDSSYLGVSTSYTGGVVVDIVEWRTSQGEVALSKDEVKELIEVLQKFVK